MVFFAMVKIEKKQIFIDKNETKLKFETNSVQNFLKSNFF